MKNLIKNADKNPDFSSGSITINAKMFSDELNKKLIKKIELISDKLNIEDKEMIAAILNSQKSDLDKLITI